MKCSANDTLEIDVLCESDTRKYIYLPTVSENGFHFVSLLVCLFALIVLIPSALFGFRPISRFRPRFLWLSDEEKGKKSLNFEHDEFPYSASFRMKRMKTSVILHSCSLDPFTQGLTRPPREDGERNSATRARRRKLMIICMTF